MIDWRWPAAAAVFSSFAALSVFKTDPQSALWVGIKAVILVVLGTFCIYTVCCRLLKALAAARPQSTINQQDSQVDPGKQVVYEAKQKQAREEAQAKTKEKAEDYQERILTPREEAKKKKKDEEFYRFMGPAWKGRGDLLGGEDGRSAESGEMHGAGAEAREIRQLPPDVQLHIPKPPDTRKRRVIELPEEPSDDTPDTTLIILRTPIGTKHKRRFLRSSTLQVCLDFMTTVGFHQSVYTLSMSYPRRPLIDQSEVTLHELDFGKQMILNIEEKDV